MKSSCFMLLIETDPPDSTLAAFTLTKPVQYGLIAAGGFLLLCYMSLMMCCCCCYCIRKHRRNRSIYIQYKSTAHDGREGAAASSGEYMSFGKEKGFHTANPNFYTVAWH